jgi:hypothetical protein
LALQAVSGSDEQGGGATLLSMAQEAARYPFLFLISLKGHDGSKRKGRIEENESNQITETLWILINRINRAKLIV